MNLILRILSTGCQSDRHGFSYHGSQSKSISGKECLSWEDFQDYLIRYQWVLYRLVHYVTVNISGGKSSVSISLYFSLILYITKHTSGSKCRVKIYRIILKLAFFRLAFVFKLWSGEWGKDFAEERTFRISRPMVFSSITLFPSSDIHKC